MIYTNKELLEKIEEFLKKTGMSASTFGTQAASSPSLVFDIREGRGCGEAVQTRILDFINNYEG